MKRIIFLFVITTIVLSHVCAQGNFSAGANSILETYHNNFSHTSHFYQPKLQLWFYW